MQGVLVYCRAHFEGDCAAELQAMAAMLGVYGHCQARDGAGYVVFRSHPPGDIARLHRDLSLTALVFARQWFVVLAGLTDLPPGDRVAPLVTAAAAMPASAGEVFVETPDTEAGKALSRLARSIAPPLRAALGRAGLCGGEGDLRIHVCFTATDAAFVGYARGDNSAPWLAGIPRIKVPRRAPSRSTAKLEEALLRFLPGVEREHRLRAGMRAVDLGAAPGGWTWLLVQRGVEVVAVDNAALSQELLDSGLVEHVRADAFGYRPTDPVDWMVCDVVERPERVADRMAQWLEYGWCRETVFNLKLPMKQRYREVTRLLERIDARLHAAGIDYERACKHLYHDRDEVTVHLRRR